MEKIKDIEEKVKSLDAETLVENLAFALVEAHNEQIPKDQREYAWFKHAVYRHEVLKRMPPNDPIKSNYMRQVKGWQNPIPPNTNTPPNPNK